MKVYNIEPTNFKAATVIKCSENKGHKYLYNEVLNLTREYHIPATFRTEQIELPSISKTIMEKLKELKINFMN